MNIRTLTMIHAAAFLLASSAFAHSFGAPNGTTGAPGESTCVACHGGTANSGPGKIEIKLINAVTYSAGQKVHLTVTVSDPTAQRWGFELTARSSATPSTAVGTLSLAPADDTAQISGATGAIQYVTHTSAGTRPGATGSAAWDVFWTAPAASAGSVTFYAAGNAANNNDAPSGDKIYSTSTALPAASATSGNTTSMALPQLDAGAGWYTAVYLTNTSSTGATALLHFFDPSGAPLAVPLGDGTVVSSQPVGLAPGASALVELPGPGAEQQGWILADLPPGVTGYEIFRSTPGTSQPQEGTVPFTPIDAKLVTVIFDNTGNLTTAFAVLNPATSDATLTITAHDSTGAALGSPVTQTLPAQSRIAFVLNDAMISGVGGKSGSVDFAVTGGAVAVLALRVNGSAFTPIVPIMVQ